MFYNNTKRETAELHYAQGKVLFDSKKYSQALEEFKIAVNKLPDSAVYYLEIGKCYLLEGSLDSAIENIEQAIKLNNNYADSHYYLGMAYLNSNNYDRAINEFKEAININPKYTEPKNIIEKISRQKINKSIKNIENTDEIPSDKNANVYFNLGNAYFQSGLLNQSLEEFKKAIALKPNYPDIRNRLGELYSQKGMYLNAIEEFKYALKINPKYITAILNLGTAYCKYAEQLFEKAENNFREVILLDPLNENAKTLLERLKAFKEIEFL